ncbi:hypothetical protein PQX77_018123 [Marasmius sp. AFHP31]|nr:hypothetical protein PQX77_018123 [Marasmius sp. AFHP31]
MHPLNRNLMYLNQFFVRLRRLHLSVLLDLTGGSTYNLALAKEIWWAKSIQNVGQMNELRGEREALSALETFTCLLNTEPFDRNSLTSQSDELEAILQGDVDIFRESTLDVVVALHLLKEWTTHVSATVRTVFGPGISTDAYHVARSNFNQREVSRAAISNAVDVSLERSGSFSFKITVTTAICPLKRRWRHCTISFRFVAPSASSMGGMNGECLHIESVCIPWVPLAARPIDAAKTTQSSGSTATKSEADRAIISRVKELAKKRGVSMAQIALAWIPSKIDCPIVGTSSIQRLEENIPSGLVLDDGEVKYLERW